MKTITGLKAEGKDKKRYKVSLNGSYFCTLQAETIVKNNFKIGMMVDEKKLEQIQLENEKLTAFEKSLKLISTRYKTKRELQRYLEEKGYLPEVIRYCLNKLTEYGYIDDNRFAEAYVTHHAEKNGINKIRQELFAKGVREEIIDESLKGIGNQSAQIRILVEKYMKNKEDTRENKIKLYRYLTGKGFTSDEILNVIRGEVEE